MKKIGRKILIIGITLLIVVLLILSSIYIRNQNLKSSNVSSDNPLKATENYTWTQDKTTVTNGEVTLEVGSKITGYEGNGITDWYVLGAESGGLLLTTNVNTKTIYLYSFSAYNKGVSTLNSETSIYRNSTLASGARAIKVDDINRVTGYSTSIHALNYNPYGYDCYKNSITYEWGRFTHGSSTDTMRFKGTKQPKEYYYMSPSKFYYPGSSSTMLSSFTSGSKTFTSTLYKYYPQTLSTTYSAETSINGSSLAYSLLFSNTSGENNYWLANTYMKLNAGSIEWRSFWSIWRDGL